VGAVLALVLVLTACSKGGDIKTAQSGTDTGTDEATDVSDTTSSESYGPDDDDAIIEKAINDVESFYESEYPKLYGEPFEPVSGGEFPYGPDDPPPDCGAPGTSNYQEVAENAFYCPPDDFVAWDTENLTNRMLSEFGPFSLAIVVAHELGHAVEARHGILAAGLPTFVTEQQADCFAGAYTAFVEDGRSKTFKVSLQDLDNALSGFLTIRDPVGIDTVNDESAHGSAFQRINAFEDGLNGGTKTCATYEDETFNFVPEVFEPGSLDEALQGNLPFDDVEPLTVANLEGFWNVAFPLISSGSEWTQAGVNSFAPDDGFTCGSKRYKGIHAVGKFQYCKNDDTIDFDSGVLMPHVYESIGDLAEGAIIGKLYSQRAEALADLPTETIEAALQADCLTGVWISTMRPENVLASLPEDATITLSPGDLDEIVAGFLQFGAKPADVESGEAKTGTAFQRLSAFRAGFFDASNNGLETGLDTCLNTSF